MAKSKRDAKEAGGFCPYFGSEPMCNCQVCQREVQAGTHISQTSPNAAEYAAARARLYGG